MSPDRLQQVICHQASLEALFKLRDARTTANDLGYDGWKFALELLAILRTGCTETQLRALILLGLVSHAIEVTEIGAYDRQFHPAGPSLIGIRSCFTITDYGVSFLRLTETTQAKLDSQEHMTVHLSSRQLHPHWSADRRELWLADELVKRFTRPAPNLELILSGFQELDWPQQMDDPLPPLSAVDQKERLHDSIKRLNRCQLPAQIKFRGDGSGCGIRWELMK